MNNFTEQFHQDSGALYLRGSLQNDQSFYNSEQDKYSVILEALVAIGLSITSTIIGVLAQLGLYFAAATVFNFARNIEPVNIRPLDFIILLTKCSLIALSCLILAPLAATFYFLLQIRKIPNLLYNHAKPILSDSKISDELEALGLSDKIDSLDIPEYYKCPITCELIKKPVLSATGHTYEQSMLQEWYANKDSDPITNLTLNPVTEKSFWPNKIMEAQIINILREQSQQNQANIVSSPTLTFSNRLAKYYNATISTLYANTTVTEDSATNHNHERLNLRS